MKVIIPPAIQGPIILGLSWFAAKRFPELVISIPSAVIIAIVLSIVGLLIIAVSIIGFNRRETTMNPLTPNATRTLVTGGLYKFSRNPMYVGVLLILLAWPTFLENIAAFAPVPLYIIFMTIFQIKPEERVLEEKFGQEYIDYKKRVRRWI